MELELAVIFILRFNLTCEAFRVLAFSPLSAEIPREVVPITLRINMRFEQDSSYAPSNVDSFHSETCFSFAMGLNIFQPSVNTVHPVEASVNGHPREAEMVSVTGASRLPE